MTVNFGYKLPMSSVWKSGRLVRVSSLMQINGFASTDTEKECPKPSDAPDKTPVSIEPSPPLTTSPSGVAVASKQSYFGYLARAVSSLWTYSQPSVQTRPAKKEVAHTPIAVKRLSRTELVNRTRGLISRMLTADTAAAKLLRSQEICQHFAEYPAGRFIALQDKHFICTLLRMVEKDDDELLKGSAQQCLSLIGYVDPPKGAGIQILSIDGGGTRGMMCLEVLQALEDRLCGPKLLEVFDYIIGTSTGAIIAVLITAKRLSIKRCKEVYMEMSRDLFSQTRFSGVSGLLTSHSYYNTKKWVRLLKQVIGEDATLLDSCRRKGAPKLGVVSSIANSPTIQPYIFRNYDRLPGRDSHFRGGCDFTLWQAIQASAAAPGYFEEVALGSVLHQDGGILANNPTALALHEARLLWPDEKVHCVVSVGSGRSVMELEPTDIKLTTGLQDKITRIVDSATDTELVHLTMHDLLPANTYFRFNPYMSCPYTLDEVDPKKLAQMGKDAQLYLRRNQAKIDAAAVILSKKPSFVRRTIRSFYNFARLRGFFLPSPV